MLRRTNANALPPAMGSSSTVSFTFIAPAEMADRPLSLISRVIPGTTTPSAERMVTGALNRYRECRLRSGEVSGNFCESTPFFGNYRPQFYFRTTDVTGTVHLPEGTEMVMPGDNISMEIELIAPIAMDEGLRFAIREGGRTVDAGVVAKIIK